MKNLNQLEFALLEEILESNKGKYPFLKFHLPYLKIKSREFTGVGSYSNFEYASALKELEEINDLISSPKGLLIDNLKYELSYVLDINKGKINFLEIVTNGNENWDGTYKNFHLINE